MGQMKNKKTDARWTFQYGILMHEVGFLWQRGDITVEQWSRYRDMLSSALINKFYPKK